MFNQNFVAQLWYFVKCIYFGLSAYQIRCGYPTRILGNFLTKKYNHLNLFLFQGYGQDVILTCVVECIECGSINQRCFSVRIFIYICSYLIYCHLKINNYGAISQATSNIIVSPNTRYHNTFKVIENSQKFIFNSTIKSQRKNICFLYTIYILG